MSEALSRAAERALLRLAGPDVVLAPDRDGRGFGVFPKRDRRRRPVARLSAAEVRQLTGQGLLAPLPDQGWFVLSDAGRARARRREAAPEEAFLAQHGPIEARSVIDPDGATRSVRAVDPNPGLRRLAALRDANGAPWLAPEELSAAARLCRDWEAGEAGLVRGSDWTAPPRGSAARAGGNAAEIAAGASCDARRRVAAALERLAPPLRRTVERVCLREEGIEALERGEGWPARSGKIALKLALAQLAR